jgi:hypothetical protein
MSEITVKKITDRAGTGAPDLSDGFKVAGTLDDTVVPLRTEGNTEPETPANGDTWYDTDNDTYDVYINDEWKRFFGGGGGAASWSVDLSNVTYDSVSFSVASQETSSFDVEFSSDGTKMYVTGFASDALHQYSLSTAFDLSTASYDNVSLDVNTLGPNPRAIIFNNDGTKMYTVGNTTDDVLQYSLSTAFDLSTASYDSVSFNVASQDATPYDLKFNADGTKMYMIGSTDTVHQYTLSTAFNVGTASYDSVSFSFNAQDSGTNGMHFNPDGTKIYVVGSSNDSVYQYTLSTGFDVSTTSYDSVSFSIAGQELSPQGLTFSTDGTKMYVVGSRENTVFQYSTGL